MKSKKYINIEFIKDGNLLDNFNKHDILSRVFSFRLISDWTQDGYEYEFDKFLSNLDVGKILFEIQLLANSKHFIKSEDIDEIKFHFCEKFDFGEIKRETMTMDKDLNIRIIKEDKTEFKKR